MTLSALIKKGGLHHVATAIPATAATEKRENIGTVARLAKVAVANPQNSVTTTEGLPPRAWVAEEIRDGNSLRGVKICSTLLQDHLWLILDRSFEPKDRTLAVYYPEELPILKTKTPEQLREIHKAKLAFPGCRVIQEGPEGSRP